ncbi:PREDICTED: probable cytochrome P450 316a1 [Drosophila arizonae]|uniref:Probable cytochrome P450 316a1 n=1 Tax=Drosophila arizonae TaxID=7263 RepID=A0ABM1PB02_DROAR|nr:PREDICTED: probable cytochrome P450 316a1 [Drosophila arizonae]
MILASIFVCFCLVSAFNYLRQRRQRGFIKNLGGPFTWPLMGAMHKIVLLSPKNFFERSSVYLAKYGAVSRIWVFHRLFIPVADLELAKQLLQSETHLETGHELMSDWLGDSLLTCQSQHWPPRHQILASLSRPDNLLQLSQLFQQQAEQLCQQLAARAEARQLFDVWQLVSDNVLDLMLCISCGMQPSEHYKQAFKELTELYRKRFLSVRSANRLTFWVCSPLTRRRQQRLIRRINEENKQMLEQRRQHKLSSNQIKIEGITIDRIEPVPRVKYQSLLELLLTSEASLTDAQLLAELNCCSFLGYLLCSSALCSALVLIARHPAVQQRCLDELREAKDSKEERLPYLEAVLKETLRLQPPQVIVNRELSQDFEYTHSQLGAGSLPAGTEIYMNLYELQRAEQAYGTKAQHFQPERFLEQPVELLSFGLGPRSCPAQQMSLSLLQQLVAPLLLQYELLPYGDALRPQLCLALGSSNGFQLALQPRKKID